MHSPILILASSRKPGGICLAGKRLDGAQRGGWVRPVWESTGIGWNTSVLDRKAGRIPVVGDVFSIPLSVSQPWEYQSENWQVGEGAWRYTGHPSNRALLPLADDDVSLWKNSWCSCSGFNDRVPLAMALRDGEGSLRLIRPDNLKFVAELNNGRRKLRAHFFYRSTMYRLCVTDALACERGYSRLDAGHNGAADALLCISLGQPWDAFCYKLVAGVIELS
jgi:hypothetical protein